MSDTLSGASEENIITLLVWSKQHAPVLASMLPVEIFRVREYRRIAQAAIDYISQFGEPPGVHIRDRLEVDIRRGGGESQSIIQAIDSMDRLYEHIQPQFVLSELDKFIRIAQKKIALEEAFDALDKGDEAKADEAVFRRNAFHADMDAGLWLHDTDMGFMGGIEEEDLFSSGVGALDARDVRPARGTLTLFIAPKKQGKSWSCTNIAKANVALHKRRVLHITLENSAKLTKRRYVQTFFAMSRKKLLDPVNIAQFEKDERQEWTGTKYNEITPLALMVDNREEITRQLHTLAQRPHVLIKEFPTGMLTATGLRAYLDNLDREFKFQPDLMIVDMPGLMKTNHDHMRLSMIGNLTELRGICVERNIAGYTPTQSGVQGETAKVVRGRDVAEAYGLTQVADTILTFCRTPEERAKGIARILVDAARDSEDAFFVMITQNYTIGQFCIDSVYMSEAARMDAEGVKPEPEE